MKKKLIILYILFLNILLFENLASNIENSIIVKIDTKIVTSFEVKNKILRSLIFKEREINQSNINNIKKQVLNNLIDLRLKEIELDKFNFEINEERLNSYIINLSKKNTEELKEEFKKYNLDFDLFVDEVKVELKWRQFIYSEYSKKIEIDENSLIDQVDKILKSKQNRIKEINLSEIEIIKNDLLSVEDMVANTLKEIEINGFENSAAKLSIANSASQNGNLGWIALDSLSSEIKKILKNVKPGQLSKPLIKNESILFLKINEERGLTNNQVNKDKLKKKLIEYKQNEMFSLFSKSHLSKLKNSYLIQYQ